MFVEEEISVENFIDSFFCRDMKKGAVVVDHIDYPDAPLLLGKFTNDVA